MTDIDTNEFSEQQAQNSLSQPRPQNSLSQPRPQNSLSQPRPQNSLSPSTSSSSTSSSSYITRVRLMDQGTFGCIYRPEIECETGNAGDYAYVSKVQKMTRTIQNEIDIGNMVKQIPHYMFWYSPLLNTCPIYFSTLKKYEEQGEKCKAIEDSITANEATNKTQTNKNPQFISSKIRYAGKYIIDYLRGLPREICAKKLLTTYEYLDTAIHRLNTHGIIHNDIKENNVLYDLYNHSPNIIDFGISYKIADLDDESKQKTIFYTTKFYPYWCIYVYVLCFITNPTTTTPTTTTTTTTINPATKTLRNTPIQEDTLASLYESYMNEFRKFAQETQITRILTDADFEKYTSSYWNTVRPYIGKKWDELRVALLTTHMYWDKYSLSIMYMAMVSKIPDIQVTKSFINNLKNNWIR